MTFIKNFISDESGASAAEYALIIAIVGVGIGAAAMVLGNNVENAIGQAADDVAACNDDTPAYTGSAMEDFDGSETC